MNKQRKVLSLLFILFACQGAFNGVAHAAPTPLRLDPGKISPPIRGGAVMGGQAADQFSLLGIRSESRAESERLVILYGDALGKPLKGELGYFHLNVDRAGKRLSLDLAQVIRTAIDPEQLKRILAKSRLIASSEMAMDPHDGSTSIVLHMKKAVQVKVAAQSKNGPGRLVLEMRELSEEKK